MNNEYDVLILYSGGADSRLMLSFAKMLKKKPYCLLINYSQLHNQELDFARNQLDKLKVDYQLISIVGLDLDSGLTGDGIKGRFGDHVSEWHVPGRNTMFAGIAFSIAENLGIKEIWLGADYSDVLNNFVDCKQEFINKINELFQVNGSYPIKFRAPLLGLEKNTILNLLKSFGIDESEIFSGYGEISTWTTDLDDIYTNDNSYSFYDYLYLWDEDDGKYKNLEQLELTYQEYVNLPSIFIPLDHKGYSPIPPGIYRLEGHDPMIHGYGIIFPIKESESIENIEQFKIICDITDI